MYTLRNFFVLFLGLLPASKLKNALLGTVGFELSKESYIGVNVIWNLQGLNVERGVTIRSGNVLKSVLISCKADSSIGSWNWITGAPSFVKTSESALKFLLCNGASISSRHYFDCSGGIEIGNFTVIAGVRSTFFTHQIDIQTNKQICKPIHVGRFSLIGSNVNVLPGARIGDYCQVGMGSVLLSKKYPSSKLLAGSPAKEIKSISGEFFNRSLPQVSV